MFARHTTSDTDAVAAARRRLAALAAEFASAEAARDSAAAGGLEASPGPGSQRDDGATVRRSDHPATQLLADDPPTAESAAADRPEPGWGDVSSGSTGSAGRHRERGAASRPHMRWGLTANHLIVAALVVIALLVVAAWWVVRAMPHAEPVEVSSSRDLPSGVVASTHPGTPPLATTSGGVPGASDPPPVGNLVVDVTGKVRRPGIVELPVGARVIDAIQDAGGVRPGVDMSGLNLARLLVDGEQVVVGLAVPALLPPPGSLPTSSVPTGIEIAPVNLNTATQTELETLPGIGPVTAQSILAWRTDNGAFTAVEELLEVSGIGDVTMADIAPYVYV